MTKKHLQKNIINRKFCICKSKLKGEVYFGNLPLINNYSKKKKLTKYPVVVTQCNKCHLIQLKYSIPDKLLFSNNYSYLSGNSKEKVSNFKSILSEIEKLSKNKSSKVLDIGSNDGSFLELVKKKNFEVLGIEPTNIAKISSQKGIRTIKKSLDIKLAKKIIRKYSKFNFIVATNFFAQTNHLVEILNSIKLLLNKEGLLIVEVQYLYDLLSQKGFDSFHHEHIAYYTLSSITKVLKKYKLYVFDAKKVKVHGGILRVFVSMKKKSITKNFKKIISKENDKNIVNKIKKLNLFKSNFSKKVKNLLLGIKESKKITYGIGAAPRACVMVNSCGLTKYEMPLVGEVAQSLKCNKYIPGTDIMVKDENKIIINKPDFVIILAWHLKERIINILSKKGYKGKFIIPLPNLKILENKK